MSVDALAAQGAELAAQAAVSHAMPAPASSFFAGAWAKLRAPSPRTDVELSDDLVAQLLNGVLDARTGGASSPAKMGEAVMDCAYALTESTGVGATTPLGRLFKASKAMAGSLLRRARSQAGAKPQ